MRRGFSLFVTYQTPIKITSFNTNLHAVHQDIQTLVLNFSNQPEASLMMAKRSTFDLRWRGSSHPAELKMSTHPSHLFLWSITITRWEEVSCALCARSGGTSTGNNWAIRGGFVSRRLLDINRTFFFFDSLVELTTKRSWSLQLNGIGLHWVLRAWKSFLYTQGHFLIGTKRKLNVAFLLMAVMTLSTPINHVVL